MCQDFLPSTCQVVFSLNLKELTMIVTIHEWCKTSWEANSVQTVTNVRTGNIGCKLPSLAHSRIGSFTISPK